MADQPQEIRLDLKEPYPNFFVMFNKLILARTEYIQLQSLLLKIAIIIGILNIVIFLAAAIMSIVLPVLSATLILMALKSTGILAGGFGN